MANKIKMVGSTKKQKESISRGSRILWRPKIKMVGSKLVARADVGKVFLGSRILWRKK